MQVGNRCKGGLQFLARFIKRFALLVRVVFGHTENGGDGAASTR